MKILLTIVQICTMRKFAQCIVSENQLRTGTQLIEGKDGRKREVDWDREKTQKNQKETAKIIHPPDDPKESRELHDEESGSGDSKSTRKAAKQVEGTLETEGEQASEHAGIKPSKPGNGNRNPAKQADEPVEAEAEQVPEIQDDFDTMFEKLRSIRDGFNDSWNSFSKLSKQLDELLPLVNSKPQKGVLAEIQGVVLWCQIVLKNLPENIKRKIEEEENNRGAEKEHVKNR